MLFFLRATDVDPEQRAIEEELFNSFLNSMVRGFFISFIMSCLYLTSLSSDMKSRTTFNLHHSLKMINWNFN